jgi:hypothetical protein
MLDRSCAPAADAGPAATTTVAVTKTETPLMNDE